MARDFTGGTDAVITGLSSSSNLRSIACWTYREGNGGNTAGRVFDRALSTGSEALVNTSGEGTYSYFISFTGGDIRWKWSRPSANTWVHLLVTYDSGSASNTPTVYVNGTSVSVTKVGTTSGTAQGASGDYIIGNNAGTGGARGWDGRMAEFAVWNRILSAGEATLLGTAKMTPDVLFRDLVCYYPLKYDLRDAAQHEFGTANGTTTVAHPPVYESGRKLLLLE